MKWKKIAPQKSQEETPAFALVSANISQSRENPAIKYLIQILILGLGIFGCAYSFLSAFGISLYTSALPVWIVLFVAITVGLYSFSNWPFLLLIPGVPLILWAFLDFEGIRKGFILVLNRVLLVMSQNSPWMFTQYQVEITQYYNQAVWLETRFLVLIFCSLTLVTGYFVVRRPNMLGLIICTAPFLVYPLFFTLMPDLLSFFALLASWLMQYAYIGRYRFQPSRHGEKKKQGVLFQGSVRRQLALLMLGCVCLSAAGSVSILSQEDYRRPEGMDEFVQSISNWLQSFGGGGRGDLTALGDLHFTGKTALEVQCPEKESVYLRGYAANIFTGSRWDTGSNDAYNRSAGSFSNLRGETVNPQYFYSLLKEGSQFEKYSVTVRPVSADKSSLYLPTNLITPISSMGNAWHYQDLYVQSSDLLGPNEYTAEAYTVDTTSSICSWEANDQELAKLTEEYESYVFSSCTDLPDDVRATAEQWLSQKGINLAYSASPGKQNQGMSEQCADVAEHVKQEFLLDYSYTYTPASWNRHRNFLDWFLNESKQGYCVHFATAGTILLRALGIPARYAEGYVITEDDFEKGEYTADGYLKVADSHAHAWTEVYDSTTASWVPVEMTPGFTSESFWESPSRGSLQPTPVPTPTSSPSSTGTPKPTETPRATQTPAPSETPDNTLSPTTAPDTFGSEGLGTGWLYSILAWLGIILLLAAVVIFRRKWILFRWQKQWKQQDVREGIRAYWKWSLEMLGCAGLPGWNEAEPEKSLHLLSEICPWMDDAFFQKALEIGRQARFGKNIPSEDDRRMMELWTDYLRKNLISHMSTGRKIKCRWVKCLM